VRNQAPLSLDDARVTPADAFAQESASRALDDLFTNTRLYRRSAAYWEMMNYVANFRRYSPYNAMLVHLQMPGARYVAPADAGHRNTDATSSRERGPWLSYNPWGR
jgi:hypothetical protein